MRNINWSTVIICALISLVVVLTQSKGKEALGGRSSDSNGDMIAVTGEYGNGTSVLWVIDTKSKQMAVYRSMNGNGLQLVGARKIEHDLKLMSYRDNTAEGYGPMELERQYRRYNAGEASPDGAKEAKKALIPGDEKK